MCDIPTSEIIDNTAEAKELREEGYYRAIAILNEVLWNDELKNKNFADKQDAANNWKCFNLSLWRYTVSSQFTDKFHQDASSSQRVSGMMKYISHTKSCDKCKNDPKLKKMVRDYEKNIFGD